MSCQCVQSSVYVRASSQAIEEGTQGKLTMHCISPDYCDLTWQKCLLTFNTLSFSYQLLLFRTFCFSSTWFVNAQNGSVLQGLFYTPQELFHVFKGYDLIQCRYVLCNWRHSQWDSCLDFLAVWQVLFHQPAQEQRRLFWYSGLGCRLGGKVLPSNWYYFERL